MTHSFPTRRSSDLPAAAAQRRRRVAGAHRPHRNLGVHGAGGVLGAADRALRLTVAIPASGAGSRGGADLRRSEEHTSELQSLMRISYAVFCLKKKKITKIE